MKNQNSISIPSHAIPELARPAGTGRLLLTTLSVALVSIAAAPKASAAANGEYEFKSASGTLRVEGDSVDIPKALVKKLAGVTGGDIVIEGNTLRLRRNATAKIVDKAADELNVDVDTSVSGPTSLVLVKSGGKYTGKTSSPIVTTFEGEALGEEFDGQLTTKVSATVQGKTLTLVIRFSGDAEGADFSGKITVVAKR